MKTKKSLFKILFLATSFASSIYAEPLKEVIAQEMETLKKSILPKERSEVSLRLARAFCKDQEVDKAFVYFLEALKCAPRSEESKLCEEEKQLFEEGLRHYLELSATDPFRAAQTLLEKYESIAIKHHDFMHLRFLLGTAYANLGKYDDFFELFYNSYPGLWDSFLAYKTQGIICLRLSQRVTSPQERENFQNEAVRFLEQALKKNPHDANLYKVLAALAKESKKDDRILFYLQTIVKQNVSIPRSDIYFYVSEAIALQDYELAQEIIDLARNRYEFSRAISAAQEYLDQHKNG